MWDVGVIAWLQQFRTPLLDAIFRAFTGLGNDLFYMLLIPVVYWAVDRRKGHRLAVVLLISAWLNGVVKEWAAMPRPDPALGIARLAEAAGPGFPSGHAQASLTFWGWLALEFPRPWMFGLAILMILGVSLSRLYLGVHFPGDVLGGWALGLGVIAAAALVMTRADTRRVSWGRTLAAVVVPLLLFPLSPSSDSERTLGFLMGLLSADGVALSAIPYGEQAGLLQHVGRLAIGLAGFFALAMAVRVYAAVGLPALFGYALVAVWVAAVAPLLFLKAGLASPPYEVQLRARQRRIPSIAAVPSRGVAPYLAIAGVVAAGVIAASWAAARIPKPPGIPALWAAPAGPLNIGHRGAAGLAPENTLVAYEQGLRHRADWLELDVHPTRDGQVVVIHDDTVDRTTNGQGPVSAMTLEEIKALDAGYRFTPDGDSFPFRGQGVQVPTLDEVLTAFPDARFIVEMKPSDPAFADRVIEVVERSGARGRVLLAGFDDAVVRRARELAPDIPTSLAMGEALRMQLMLRLGLGAFWRPPASAAQLPERYGALPVVTEAAVRLLHRRGVPVHVWTVNEIGDMRRLAALGVDGIITDYPDRMQTVLAERATAGAGRPEP